MSNLNRQYFEVIVNFDKAEKLIKFLRQICTEITKIKKI